MKVINGIVTTIPTIIIQVKEVMGLPSQLTACLIIPSFSSSAFSAPYSVFRMYFQAEAVIRREVAHGSSSTVRWNARPLNCSFSTRAKMKLSTILTPTMTIVQTHVLTITRPKTFCLNRYSKFSSVPNSLIRFAGEILLKAMRKISSTGISTNRASSKRHGASHR